MAVTEGGYYIILEAESEKLRHQLIVYNADEHYVPSLTLVVTDVVEGSVLYTTYVL